MLLIDLDPQANLTLALGVPRPPVTIYEAMRGESGLQPVTAKENLDVVASTLDLSGAEMELINEAGREFILQELFDPFLEEYDFIIIDCPPSLNLLTVNALVAANSVLIPLQSEFFALEGLSQLMLTIREIRQTANTNLRVEGVLLTMHDQRNNLSQQVERDARDTLGALVYQTVIPRNVRLSEAPSFAVPALTYDPTSKGALAYQSFAREFLKNNNDLHEEA